jgi:hypothetical protein
MREPAEPATARLALLLQNPDLLAFNFEYHSVREVFIKMVNQLEDAPRTVPGFAQA